MVQDDGRRSVQHLSVDDSHFSDSFADYVESDAEARCDRRRDNSSGQETTGWTTLDSASLSVAIIDDHSFTRECITRSLNEADARLNVSPFSNCEDCINSSKRYDVILYHARCEQRPSTDAGREPDAAHRPPFARILEIAPIILLSDSGGPKAILEALEWGARGYIPTQDTTLKLVLEIIRLVRAGGTFVPASSLALRFTDRRGSAGASAESREAVGERFTPRQLAVLHHLKQGKANKTIARELAMSESTVKIHLRNIMKKMNASNRTEVACRAHALDGTWLSLAPPPNCGNGHLGSLEAGD